MNEDINPALGISRRDLLKRGAVVGGTLVWAAPAVQTISRSALAQSPGTPPPDEPVDGAISYVALVLNCGGALVRVKYETGDADASDATVGGGWVDPGETPQCPEPDDWDAAEKRLGSEFGIVVTGTKAHLCFDLSASGCSVLDGTAKGRAGILPPGAQNGFCVDEEAVDATTVCFTDPTA